MKKLSAVKKQFKTARPTELTDYETVVINIASKFYRAEYNRRWKACASEKDVLELEQANKDLLYGAACDAAALVDTALEVLDGHP